MTDSRQPETPPADESRLDARTVLLIGLAIPLGIFLCIVVAQAILVRDRAERAQSLTTDTGRDGRR